MTKENGRRADLNKNPDEIAAMFDGVARRYDIANDILSLGRTRAWRKKVKNLIAPTTGMQILDLAAGTGSSSEPLAKAGASVTALDFSEGMLAAGRKRRPYINFVLGDALALPFEKNSFDVTTISFGLRNTNNFDKALSEALRVTKLGGRLFIVEFSEPTFKPFRYIYMEYLMRALPWIAKRATSNPEAYIYLAESIRAWPNQRDLARRVVTAGWSDVHFKNMTGGVVAVHIGTKAR